MNLQDLLNADVSSIGEWIRQGFSWWVDELSTLLPASWRDRLSSRPKRLVEPLSLSGWRHWQNGRVLGEAQAMRPPRGAVGLILPTDTVLITIGSFSSMAQRTHGYLVDGSVTHAIICAGDTLLVPPGAFSQMGDQERKQTSESSLRNAMTAVEELMYLESLAGFTGWPDLPLPTTLTVGDDGRIEVG